MNYQITEECISCGACYQECKINAIKNDATPYAIDQEICVACGACQFICDFGAIVTSQA
ncbi:MAG: 4Fe-4S binding protein [Desulfuromonadaceae bacterium]|nr:4Fe-4S binding protein [Desulfuromonadaceae bacterium]